MVCCTSSATTTKPMRRRPKWNSSSACCSRALALATPMDQPPTSMADPGPPSRLERPERTHLPVVVSPPRAAAREGLKTWLARMLRALFGWKPGSIRDDLEIVLEAASGETGFSPEERAMLTNILDLRERRVEDVMVPRADIVAVEQDITLGELVKVFEGAGHSRLVAYHETLDEPVGMVHIRDLIAFMAQRAAVDGQQNGKRTKPVPAGLDLKAINLSLSLASTGIIRKILFVPPSMPAIDLLAKMQATRIHLALVIDEYGGTDGLVSMEDIVEQIVGDIVDARASLEEVAAAIGPEFDIGDAAEEVDTIGGYLVAQVGRLPVRGEIVPGPGRFEFEVLDADPRRVKKLKIHRSRQLRVAADGGAARPARATTSPAPASDPASPT